MIFSCLYLLVPTLRNITKKYYQMIWDLFMLELFILVWKCRLLSAPSLDATMLNQTQNQSLLQPLSLPTPIRHTAPSKQVMAQPRWRESSAQQSYHPAHLKTGHTSWPDGTSTNKPRASLGEKLSSNYLNVAKKNNVKIRCWTLTEKTEDVILAVRDEV